MVCNSDYVAMMVIDLWPGGRSGGLWTRLDRYTEMEEGMASQEARPLKIGRTIMDQSCVDKSFIIAYVNIQGNQV